MAGDESVTFWLDGVKLGDDPGDREALGPLLPAVGPRCCEEASRHNRRDVDEEDVALQCLSLLLRGYWSRPVPRPRQPRRALAIAGRRSRPGRSSRSPEIGPARSAGPEGSLGNRPCWIVPMRKTRAWRSSSAASRLRSSRPNWTRKSAPDGSPGRRYASDNCRDAARVA